LLIGFPVGEQFALDVGGKAARPDEGPGIFVGQERSPDIGTRAAAERTLADIGEHLLKHAVDEHGLEILRRVFRFVEAGGGLGVASAERRVRGRC
jgi:hypothetical protein